MLNQETEDKIKDLLRPKDGLLAVLETTRVVEDVLSNNLKSTPNKASIKQGGIGKPIIPPSAGQLGAAMEQGVRTYTGTIAEYKESPYLPRNSNEHPDEYKKRLAMTPMLSETPSIMQSRMGSMFKKPPTVSLPPELEYFKDDCTLKHSSLNDVFARTLDRSQVNGFNGILLDRVPLDEETATRAEAGEVSQAEKTQRKLGKPILALYTAWQILDWDEDEDGMSWVKLIETYVDKKTYDAKPETVQCVRIVDRTNITKFEIRKREGEDPVLKTFTPVPHGRVDEDKEPICPFWFCAPLLAEDGIGRSVVRGCAEADVTALRILSDLLWMLHLTAPLLVLHTDRPEDEIPDIGLGSSRFNVLKPGMAQGEGKEELNFVQLDVQALDRMFVAYDKFTAKAREQADRMNLGSITGTGEVSGVSKAWTFKTSEERILYLFGHTMQEVFEAILKQIARDEGLNEEQVSVQFPETYDIQGPTDQLTQSDRFLTICQTFDLKKAAAMNLERLCASILQNPDQEAWQEVLKEIEVNVANADTIKPEDPAEQGEGPNGQKKTNGGNYRKKTEVPHADDKKADDEGEDPEDRKESDAADYQGNRKT